MHFTRNQPSHSVVAKLSINGIVKCAAIGLGARSKLSDFGMSADVVVRTDSPSGLAVGSRRELGRLQHVQTRYLWVQQRVQQGDLRLKKEVGDTIVSDALTKSLDEKRMTNLLKKWVTSSEMGAHRWRQSQHDNRCCFQQYGVFSSKIF